jgi:NAD-specific glutamate dehydrogenase
MQTLMSTTDTTEIMDTMEASDATDYEPTATADPYFQILELFRNQGFIERLDTQ